MGEVKVLLNNYQAEYGRNGGAMINLITKSGTRDFHGSAYWYKRHEMFNAQNFFNNRNKLAKAPYRYTTLGASLGGPVSIPGVFNTNREKLFFFFNFETNPSKEPKTIVQRTMPTAPEIGGDFSQSLTQSGTPFSIKDPTTRRPVPRQPDPGQPPQLQRTGADENPPRAESPRSDCDQGSLQLRIPGRLQIHQEDRTVQDRLSSERQRLLLLPRHQLGFRTGRGKSLSSGSFEFARAVEYLLQQACRFELHADREPDHGERPEPGYTPSAREAFPYATRRSREGSEAVRKRASRPGSGTRRSIPTTSSRRPGFTGGIANGPDFGNFYWYRMPQYEDDINWTISDGFTINRAAHTFKVGMYYEKVADHRRLRDGDHLERLLHFFR